MREKPLFAYVDGARVGHGLRAGQGKSWLALQRRSRECECDDGEQEEEAQCDAQLGHDPLCRGAIDRHATSQIDNPE